MPAIRRLAVACAVAFSLVAGTAHAGPIFLTGHDPDFHTQTNGAASGAGNFLTVGLNYAMGGLLNDNVHKFLWVESALSPSGGHVTGFNSLPLIGLTVGQDYDVVNAAGLATANLSNYTAIAVASSFGGMLTSAELNELIARSADIATFINAGGGLFASSECEPTSGSCLADTLAAAHGALFGFLPISVSSVPTTTPYTLTAFGATLGFSVAGQGYINECCTHNSFGLVGGLNVVDYDPNGLATPLAGVANVGPGGFTPPVPEPGTMTLLGLGLAVGARRVRARRQKR